MVSPRCSRRIAGTPGTSTHHVPARTSYQPVWGQVRNIQCAPTRRCGVVRHMKLKNWPSKPDFRPNFATPAPPRPARARGTPYLPMARESPDVKAREGRRRRLRGRVEGASGRACARTTAATRIVVRTSGGGVAAARRRRRAGVAGAGRRGRGFTSGPRAGGRGPEARARAARRSSSPYYPSPLSLHQFIS